MLLDDDDLPVLNDIVQTGDPSVIETQRKRKTAQKRELDQRIDRLIEKHMTALRVDIKIALLTYASHKPD